MTTLRASVVIPTYRRRDSLLRALAALDRQTLPAADYEVVVVVDGSDDGTAEAAAALTTGYPLRVLSQPNRGRAAACNAGISAARGEVVVLLDDDMEPAPELLAAHLRAHPAGERRAVIGAAPIRVEPSMPVHAAYVAEKFNRHLEQLARAGGPLALRDFYSGNFSVRRDVIRSLGGFDERFRAYGNEDLELSIRLAAADVRLVYEPAALAWQSYDKSFAALARDNVAKGRTAVLLARIHPAARAQLKLASFAREPIAKRLAVHALLAATRVVPRTRDLVVAMVERLGARGWRGVWSVYPIVLDYLYWCGAREAEREPAPERTA